MEHDELCIERQRGGQQVSTQIIANNNQLKDLIWSHFSFQKVL